MKNLEIKKTIVGCKRFMTEQLCKEFHCTDRYVRYALSYQRNGKVCQAIRVRALELGASVTPLWAIPEMVTTHDETRGKMIQSFGDKTRIEFDKAIGQAIVYNHGEPIIKATLVEENELLLLQEKVRYIAAAN